MALITCTECGHSVSDQARSCPGCGAPVIPMLSSPPPAVPVEHGFWAASEAEESPEPGATSTEAGRTVDSLGQVFGAVGIVLGIASVLMPYFAAVFLVPAAFVCGLVALIRRQKFLGIVAVLFAAFGLIGVIYVSNQITTILKDPFSASSVLDSDSPQVVTLAEYNQLQEGMSYQDAARIIGDPGEEISRTDISGYTTVMYSWTNSGGSNMNAMFQNDELVSKAQFGLR